MEKIALQMLKIGLRYLNVYDGFLDTRADKDWEQFTIFDIIVNTPAWCSSFLIHETVPNSLRRF